MPSTDQIDILHEWDISVNNTMESMIKFLSSETPKVFIDSIMDIECNSQIILHLIRKFASNDYIISEEQLDSLDAGNISRETRSKLNYILLNKG